jgi:hypothetical protein
VNSEETRPKVALVPERSDEVHGLDPPCQFAASPNWSLKQLSLLVYHAKSLTREPIRECARVSYRQKGSAERRGDVVTGGSAIQGLREAMKVAG